MNEKLFIADKIKVGFNPRNDTYTGMLGYVIGHDGKKWRKEPSWDGWRYHFQDGPEYDKTKRTQFNQQLANMKSNSYYKKEQIEKFENEYDKFQPYGRFSDNEKLKPVEYENVPTEGFVLNKKAGGYSSGWNHRSTYCRVYDPRGFEFEISIPNLLFILQECNAYKGKGLEGSFIYAWDGKDLVLLPTTCDEYQQSRKHTNLQSCKVSAKELIQGCSYKSKKQVDLIYLGKFNWFESNYRTETNYSKEHIFVDNKGNYEHMTSLTSLALKISDVPVSNYAELVDNLLKSKHSGDITSFEVTAAKIKYPGDGYYNRSSPLEGTYYLELGNGRYRICHLQPEYDGYSYYSRNKPSGYHIKSSKVLVTKDNEISIKSLPFKDDKKYSERQINEMGFKTITVITDKNKDKHFKLTA